MKKISSLLIAVIFLVSMLIPVSADGFTQENITIEQNVYDITVKVTTDTDGRMIIRLSDAEKSALYGLDFSNTPTEENGVYTYTFSFTLLNSVPTSVLSVCVSNNVPETEKTFNYTNIDDKNSFYNNLDAIEDASLIKGYFVANSKMVSVDLTEYNDLSDTPREMVDEIIEGLDLATDYENLGTETPEYTQNKAAAVTVAEEKFKTAFAEAMKYAKIIDAEESEWTQLAASAVADGLFDGKYYTATETEEAVLVFSDVYGAFATEAVKMTTLSAEEMKKAFDRATLLAVKNNCAYGTLKKVFMYLEDKGTVVVSDMTDIDTLVSAGNDLELWQSLKEAACTDCAGVVAKAVEIADTIMEKNGAGSGSNAPSGSINSGTTSPGGFSGGSLGGGGGSPKPTAPVTPIVPEGTFSDIDSVEWAKESIEALAEMGVLSGKGDGKFYPNDSVTREEFVKIIVAAFDLSDDEAECEFSDVSKDSWSYPYIAAANKLGIVSGDGELFNPASGISRQDMAVIIYRVFEYLELKVEGEKIAFDDNGEISDYAKAAVDALTAAGIINGMGDGTFAPKGTVTRAQAAKVVYGLLDLVGGGK